MANLNFRSQFAYSYSAKAVKLRAKISIAAAGAPTIVSGTGMAITSIVRNGAGDYSIRLSQSYAALLDVQAVFESGTSAPAAPDLNIRTDAVATASAPILRVQFRDIAGAAADPAPGEIMHLTIELHDSSTGY